MLILLVLVLVLVLGLVLVLVLGPIRFAVRSVRSAPQYTNGTSRLVRLM
jgi:hypothetical protein